MRLKPSVKLFLIVLLLIGAMVSTWLVVGHRKARERRLSGVPESRARLVEMLGSSRPFEGRLLGMSYASFDPARARKPLSRSRLKEALALATENRDDTEAEHLANAALVYSLGDELDLAIQSLTRATTSKGAKPWMWGDLSAFYMERFRKNNDSRDLLKALESSAHVQDSPSLPFEARFNYALSLQKLPLAWSAQKSWLRYLRYDPGSKWANEARLSLESWEHLLHGGDREEDRRILDETALRGNTPALVALVSQNAQASREYGEEQLLGEWGLAWSKGRHQESDRILIIAREIGRALELSGRDPTLADSVSSIDKAIHGKSRKHVGRLARGHQLYLEGLAYLGQLNFEKALDAFEESRELLSSEKSPFLNWVLLRIAVCYMQQFHYGQALSVLTSLAFVQEYPSSLRGVALWSIGLIRGIQARPAEAINVYQTAAALFRRLSEMENVAVVESLIATSFRSLGDDYMAWHHELKALHLKPYVHASRKKIIILDEAEALLRQSGALASALPFQEEMLAESSIAQQPVLMVTGLRKMAILCNELGWNKMAGQALTLAKRHLQDILDADAHSSLAGDILMIEGQILVDSDPKMAVELLTPALRIYNQTHDAYQLTGLLFRRAKAYVRLNDLDLAENDLSKAISIIEQQRLGIPEASLQEQFLDQSREIFELMVDLQINLGRPEAALGYIEQFRASTILFSHQVSVSDAMEFVSNIQGMLEGDVVLVEYFIFNHRVHAWLMRHDCIQHFDLSIDQEELEQEVEALDSAVKGGRGVLRLSGNIEQQLLGRISKLLKDGERLVFIPDGPLHQISFAALWNLVSHHYLIQDYPVAVAPSAAVYATAVARTKSMEFKFDSVLAVGDPIFDRNVWPSLESLRGARSEVNSVGRLYSKAKILVGVNARVSEFLRLSQGYSVIHLASHAIINRDQPLLSLLLLSSSGQGGDQGILYARDLYRLRFPATRLIVLAACTSLGESSSGREGLSSLARPFLSGGVPAVLGTLWPVEDFGAQEFLVRFHKNVLAGGDPVRALQKTQIDSIVNPTSLSARLAVWAAFQLIGS